MVPTKGDDLPAYARRLAAIVRDDPQLQRLVPTPSVETALATPGLTFAEAVAIVLDGYATRPALGERAYQVGRDPRSRKTQVRYGRVELEGDHVSAGQLNARQQAALSGSDWKGPHKANDTVDPRFAASDEVSKIRGYGVALQKYLGVKAVKSSKYVASRELLAARGVRFDRGKLMVKGLYRTRPKNGAPPRVSQRGAVKAKKARR